MTPSLFDGTVSSLNDSDIESRLDDQAGHRLSQAQDASRVPSAFFTSGSASADKVPEL